MAVFGLLWTAVVRRKNAFASLRRAKLRSALTVAIPDACDTFFMVYGIAHAGSGIFIIVFAFVTVWTALFRWCVLRRNLLRRQWLAVLLIAGGQCVVVGGTQQGANSTGVLLGAASTLVAALCDAVMYVFTEKVLTTPDDGGVSDAQHGSSSANGDGGGAGAPAALSLEVPADLDDEAAAAPPASGDDERETGGLLLRPRAALGEDELVFAWQLLASGEGTRS